MEQVSREINEQIRSFNRFYSEVLGLLDRSAEKTPYSIAEARMLSEIKRLGTPTASDISRELKIDPGHVSRLIRYFETHGILARERSPVDGRAYILKLTADGKRILRSLEKITDAASARLLAPLSECEMPLLLHSMGVVQSLLSKAPTKVTVRPAKMGELGVVALRHMDFYGGGQGFDMSFETSLFDVMARFLKNRMSGHGQAWVADHRGVVVGSVAIDHTDRNTARLRWLLVSPGFRRRGIGRRLIEEALLFCREKRYRKVFLLTFQKIAEARELFDSVGLYLVEEETREAWGRSFTEERWELALTY